MTKTNQLRSGAILSYVLIILNCAVNLVVTPFLVNHLGNSQYGLYSLAGSLISYTSILDLGIGNVISRKIAEFRLTPNKKVQENFLAIALRLYFLLAVIVIVAGVAVSLNAEAIFYKSLTASEIGEMRIMLLILTFNMALSLPMNWYTSIITGYEQFIVYRSANILRVLVRIFVIIVLVLSGCNVVAITVIDTVLNCALFIFYRLFCRRTIKITQRLYHWDKTIVHTILSFSVWMLLNCLCDQVTWNTDQTIIGIKLSSAAVAYYAVGANISNAFVQLSTAIAGVTLPRITQIIKSNKNPKCVVDFMIRAGKPQCFLLTCALLGYFLVGRQFITLWMGPGYEQSWWVGLWSMLALYIPLCQNTVLPVLQVMEKYKFYVLIYVGVSLVNIAGTWFIVNLQGIAGAAFMTFLCFTFGHTIIANLYYHFGVGLNIPRLFKEIFKGVPLAVLLTLFPFYFLIRRFAVDTWLKLIMWAILIVAFYSVMLFLFALGKKKRKKLCAALYAGFSKEKK